MCNQKHQALFLALLAFLLPSVLKADNVAKVGDVGYETLREAIQTAAETTTNIVVDLTADATLDITAWNGTKNSLSIGKENTETITINGNGHKLTFDQKNSDWNNVATMNDAKTVLTLNNMSITNSGHNNGPWNRHDINFNCTVVLNDVTSDKALAFKNSATLKNVTITEDGTNSVDDKANEAYGIWISPRVERQTINIDGLNLTATNGSRGIKIDDQYLNEEGVTTAQDVILNIANSSFNTEKKAAILVKSPAKTIITAEKLDIANVKADSENAVWVDEAMATQYGNVTLTGDATMGVEGGAAAFEATVTADGKVSGYYKTLAAAIEAATTGQTVTLLKNVDATGAMYSKDERYNLWISKGITIDGAKNTLIVKGRGIGIQGGSNNIDVTFKDITIKNIGDKDGRCIDTRGKVGTLTLIGATLTTAESTYTGYLQPLTIGGNQADDATVNISNSQIISVDAANKGYAITTFNPVKMTIDKNSVIKGWACINAKGSDSSAGSKNSVFTVNNSNLVSANGTPGDTNAYSAIKIEDDNVSVSITNSVVSVNGGGNTQSIVSFQKGTQDNSKNCSVSLGDGNTVTLEGDYKFAANFDESSSLSISGGTFNVAVPEEYCADGYIPCDLGNGTYGVKEGSYVAQIDDVKYETFEAAFAAAQDGETITLLADCAGNGIIAPQGKFATGITVDFARHTYTVDGSTVGSTGTETNGFQLLRDNKITFKNGTITSEKAKILIQNYSDLTLQGMTLTLNNAGYTSAYTLSNNNGNIVIDGSTINANPAGGFAFDVCRYSSYPSVSVEVKGESVIKGNIEISASGSDAKDGFGLKLTAGKLSGNIVMDPSAVAAMAATPDKVVIAKSADFTAEAPKDYKWVEAESGMQKLVVCEYVAQVGEDKYETFEAAFAAVGDGQTITLLADCTGNGIKAPQAKFTTGITVDFDGHTYTVDGSTVGSTGTETNGFQLLKDNKITFKNGTITSEKAKILIQNYSNLTLEGMTLTMNNTNYTGAYTLSNNCGNIVIDGSTINANPAGGFAFDVCRYSSYPSVNVEVKGKSQINGNIEIFASGSDAKDGFGLKLTAGTLTGDIVMDPSAVAAMATTPDKAVIAKSAEFEANAPEGYKWVEGENGVSTLAPIVYVAQIGDKKYETLQAAFDAAEAEDIKNIVVDLLADATLDITAWDGNKNSLSIGTVNTESITINGNSHTLTFNQKNSDWNNVATMNDAQTKLVLNNMHITSSGHNDGPWNRHDINFNCAVELNNVTSERPMAFKNSATLKNVTINDTKDVYAIWISPRVEGQKIEIDGLNVTCGRGIKIDDQYVDNPVPVSLDIQNATFNTAKKAAILVKSAAETTITAGEGIDISNVAADQTNLVWVDEDKAEEYYNVSVEGASLAPEKIAEYVATLVRGEQTRGYYKTFAAAYASTDYADGDTYALLKNTTETVEIAKVLTIVKNGFTAANVSAAEGYKKTETDEEIAIAKFHPVCEIANVKYETLEEAFAAAQDGQTVTLLADCAGNGIIAPQGKFANGLTVDFGGHTYTINGATLAGSTGTKTQAFQLLKGNTITFKNGAIVGDNADVKMMIQNYSNLTLDGMTLDATQGTNNIGYVLSTNNGTTTIKDTKITAKSTGWAFDACSGWGSYQSNSVELTGTSEINGNIEVSYFGQKGTAPASLTLTAGTLNGNIVMAQGADKCSVTKSSSFTAEAPKDYKWVDAESGMQKLVACEYVAQVGEDKYETFEAAAEAAGENVITLLANIEDNYTLASGKTLKVNKNGKTLNVVAAEGSILDETTDGDVTTYTAALASETDIVLVDGEPYTFTADTQVKSATFIRKFTDKITNIYLSWFVPFDYTITEKDIEKFDFFKINMVANSPKAGEVEESEKVWLFLNKMKAGDVMRGNMPYIFKAKEAVPDGYEFKAENALLKAKNEGVLIATETMTNKYSFYGTYDKTTLTPSDSEPALYLGNEGSLSYAVTKNITIGTYRWIIRVSSKNGGIAYVREVHFVDDSESTGVRNIVNGDEGEVYFTLDGVKVEVPAKGVFIKKCSDGTMKKVMFK